MIKVKHLVKKFGNFTAVDDISFEIEPGERFALLGPNGAGKSTTIKMLTTLLRPTSGTLELNGHNVVKDQAAARKSFGIVFQDPSVDVEMTAYENMQLHAVLYSIPKSQLESRIKDLLELVDLWDRKDSFVKTYSGGMKRRLEIARGLLHHPKLLFLDEPTLGLDAQTRNLLWDYVQKLSREQNMTIFFTTHYLEEAEINASRIAFIDQCKIIATGTAKDLMNQTKTKTLEQAYLKLTGVGTRDNNAGPQNAWAERNRAKAMR
ncbi:MAG TPA: ATP-binding cassette domain-containing protein [Candidatus Saccharimonadales bacterium]